MFSGRTEFYFHWTADGHIGLPSREISLLSEIPLNFSSGADVNLSLYSTGTDNVRACV